MMKKYRITVVTICYNAVENIEKTILSVINQNYRNLEYIIVDGGSNDGTLGIIKKYEKHISKFISEPDNGIYDAMNKGIRLANGDYINFMNAGDSFYDNRVISKIVENIDDDIMVVYGDTLFQYNGSHKISKALPFTKLRYKGIFCHQSAFTSLQYHKHNEFSHKYRILADFNFFYQAYNRDSMKFKQVDFVVSNFDMSDGGLSKANYEKNYIELRDILSDHVSVIYLLWLRLQEKLGQIKRWF